MPTPSNIAAMAKALRAPISLKGGRQRFDFSAPPLLAPAATAEVRQSLDMEGGRYVSRDHRLITESPIITFWRDVDKVLAAQGLGRAKGVEINKVFVIGALPINAAWQITRLRGAASC